MKQNKEPVKQAIAEVPPEDANADKLALRMISMTQQDDFKDGIRWGQWCRAVAGAGLGKDGKALARYRGELRDAQRTEPPTGPKLPEEGFQVTNYGRTPGVGLACACGDHGKCDGKVRDGRCACPCHVPPTTEKTVVKGPTEIKLGFMSNVSQSQRDALTAALAKLPSHIREHAESQMGAAGEAKGQLVGRFTGAMQQAVRRNLLSGEDATYVIRILEVLALGPSLEAGEGTFSRLHKKIADLEAEVEVLRQCGNKDCTAQADEELERRNTTRPPGVVPALVPAVLNIQVNGRLVPFVNDPDAGPLAMDANTLAVLDVQPWDFLEAANLWQKQGSRTDGPTAVWDAQPMGGVQ